MKIEGGGREVDGGYLLSSSDTDAILVSFDKVHVLSRPPVTDKIGHVLSRLKLKEETLAGTVVCLTLLQGTRH